MVYYYFLCKHDTDINDISMGSLPNDNQIKNDII